jgi:hypothetical protein
MYYSLEKKLCSRLLPCLLIPFWGLGCFGHSSVSVSARQPPSEETFLSSQNFLVEGFDTITRSEIHQNIKRRGIHRVISTDEAENATVLVRTSEGERQQYGGVFNYEVTTDNEKMHKDKKCKKRQKKTNKCIKWQPEENWVRYSIEEQCVARFDFEVVNVESGQLLFSGDISEKVYERNAKDRKRPKALGKKKMCIAAKKQVVSSMGKIWGTNTVNVDIKILKLESNKPLYERIVSLVKKQALAEAILSLEKAVNQNLVSGQDLSAAKYTLIQLYWAEGEYNKCRVIYKETVVGTEEKLPGFLFGICSSRPTEI